MTPLAASRFASSALQFEFDETTKSVDFVECAFHVFALMGNVKSPPPFANDGDRREAQRGKQLGKLRAVRIGADPAAARFHGASWLSYRASDLCR